MSRVGGLPTAVYKSGTATVAQLPDGTIVGGNARGTNATDLQTLRALATQVASGVSSTIAGGESNSAAGLRAFVGGGDGNTASNTRGTVVGGTSNLASGINSFIGGGANNVASMTNATIVGGSTNTASGLSSWSPGGAQASTRGLTGAGAWSSGRITANGDTQVMASHLSAQTTDATATRLTSGTGAAATTNTINLPNFAAYTGRLQVIGKATGTTDAAVWHVDVSALRGNGVATTALFQGASVALLPTASNGTGSVWRLDIAADTTTGGIAVTVTGALATTINWSASYIGPQVTTAS